MHENIERMKAEIDLMENAVYAIKDGMIHKVRSPESGFGRQIICWQGNKPCNAKLEEDIKI